MAAQNEIEEIRKNLESLAADVKKLPELREKELDLQIQKVVEYVNRKPPFCDEVKIHHLSLMPPPPKRPPRRKAKRR